MAAARKKQAAKQTAGNSPGNGGGGKPRHIYKPEYCEQAYKYCLLGAKDKELARLFEVSHQAIDRWKRAYPEFREALEAGKAEADAKVAESLYRRALGYEHPEEKIFCTDGEVTRVQTVKKYAPDTTAAIFWLKNRDPDNWRDVSHIRKDDPRDALKTLTADDQRRIAENVLVALEQDKTARDKYQSGSIDDEPVGHA